MARVHVRGVRYRIREAVFTGIVQQYTGQGTVDIRKIFAKVEAGEPVTLHVDDADAAYELATQLGDLGVNAEPDEGDY